MRILAIETASPPGSIALLENDQFVCGSSLTSPRKTTQQFALLIQSLLENADWKPRDIETIATTIGPGSFTGLRIGVTAAKVFAYAVGCPTVGISTLEVIATQCPTSALPIEAVIDAQRKQLFAARFQRIGNELTQVQPTQILDGESWLMSRATDALLTGTGIQHYVGRLMDASIVDQKHWVPRAETLGRLAYVAAQRGETIDPLRLVPQYFRQSAAEEKFQSKQVNTKS